MKSSILIYILVLTTVNTESPCDQVSFVDRAGWNAREPTAIANITQTPLSFYIIHHTYEPASCYDDETCIQRVQSIQNYHQNERNWSDIGYHFLVGENGKVYEGRGWNRQGAHSPGWNNDAYGICLIGDFSINSPNERALNALRLWIDCGIKQGHVSEDYYLLTHRQSQQPGYTTCPGNGAFDQVNQWCRFCSYQNSGTPQNETQPNLARRFCKNELQ